MAAHSFIRKLIIRRGGGDEILGITDFSDDDFTLSAIEGAVSCATSVWLNEGDTVECQFFSTNTAVAVDIADQVGSRFNISLLAGAPFDP